MSSELPEATQGWLLNEAAFSLRALGRLTEAIVPMRAGLRVAIDLEDWRSAAAAAANLGELQLALGDVASGVRNAEESVVYSDLQGDWDLCVFARTTLGDALHHAGHREEAITRFLQAEEMQAERQPSHPLLYSVPGFRYCDLLLADAERSAGGVRKHSGATEACEEVERRARKMLEWQTPGGPILDIALDHLALGRSQVYRALLAGSDPGAAEPEVDQAVDGLRRAGQSDELPKGLLTRAWLRAAKGRLDDARADLAEAEEIAKHGSMPLFLADVHLYRARLFYDRAALAEARRLVEKHGYFRRREELEDLEAAADRW